MKVEKLVEIIGSDFYTGIPDSQIKALCNYLMQTFGIDKKHHIIAANEGNSVALAAGYYLATGRIPVIYMQNSGEGNIINPVASLMNEKVYAIPAVFVIGWRGEPGVHDEPQHIYQGKVTIKLLEEMDIKYFIISEETTEKETIDSMEEFKEILSKGKQVAFVIRKNALTYGEKIKFENAYPMTREEVIRHIIGVSGDDPVISTTGKTSRELFELREAYGQKHKYDFLTIGSMGHSSSIALGVALNTKKKVWCIDGDGSMLMHMGSMAVIGTNKPENLIHIVINNGAHESVGGLPTVGEHIDIPGIARACGYPNVASVADIDALDNTLKSAKEKNELSLIEIKCQIGARKDLGRPTITAIENKRRFMQYMKS